MASNLDLSLDNEILDVVTKGGSVTVAAPVKLRLLSAVGDNDSNGTEITAGGGYSSGGVQVDNKFAYAAAVSGRGSVTTNADVTVTNMPACTVKGAELWDSSGTPKRLAQGALAANKTVAAGDTFTIKAGSLTFSLA